MSVRRHRRPRRSGRRPAAASDASESSGSYAAVEAEFAVGRDDSDTLAMEVPGDDAPLTLPAGGYRLGEEIGRGGYGLIRLATQEILQRPVAIKSLMVDRSNPRRRRVFYAEAVITGMLQHPNIVPIYDCFESDGELRLVMKRISGVTWNELLHPETAEQRQQAAGMSLDDHLDILIKIAEAVHYAHDHGFLHRDIKPHNVMIGAYGEVLLMDWGCAVSFGDRRVPGVPHLDDATRLAGTPAYMPPEMARGRTDQLGPRSDVFQLGALLYEILTGCRPYQSDTPQETVKRAARGRPTPPHKRSPDRRIPPELDLLCLRTMRTDPANRPSSAQSFVIRLKRAMRHREADRLVERALALIARAQGDHGLDHFARAQTCLEQAIELWPRCTSAIEELHHLGIAYAEAALEREAWQLAESQAQATIERLAAVDDPPAELLDRAEELIDLARTGRDEQAGRRRSVHRLRRLARVGVVLLATLFGIGLGIALVVYQPDWLPAWIVDHQS